MTDLKRPREPMFNFSEKLPAYLAGVFIAIEFISMFLPESLMNILTYLGVLRPLGSPNTDILSHAISLIGHGFLHGGWGHVLINSGMVIVFGIAVIRASRLHSAAMSRPLTPNRDFMLIFLAGVIIGGLFQWGWWAATNAQLGLTGAVGASGGASALFAAGGWAIGGRPKMIQFGIGWALINAVMVVAEPILGFNLAWPAHIGGYIGGMLLAPHLIKPNATNLSI